MYDVIVVGAGPAGLSAALMLGRSGRRVLVCDTGTPRNAAARTIHGLLSRDGIAPVELLRIAREQLRPYDTVELRDVEVTAAECRDARFRVTLAGGSTLDTRKLLIATGVVDNLPDLPGFTRLYGASVFHCPYCDGWEVRDRPLAIYGRGDRGFGLSLELTGWSRDLVLCTDGPSEIAAEGLARLDRHGIRVLQDRVVRLEGDERPERIVFATGAPPARHPPFFQTGQTRPPGLAGRLRCGMNDKGAAGSGK